MTEQTQTKLEGKLNFPKVKTSLLKGEEAQSIYESLGDYITQISRIFYDSETKTVKGSNHFLAASIDSRLRHLGIRVTNLRDLSRPEVMEKVEGKHYSDTPVLVLRSMEDHYERNEPLIKRIAEEVEKKNGRLELPIMISGFDVKPWPEDEKGYGIDIVPRNDFTAIHDERLLGKYNRMRFSEVNELGLSEFDKKGTRIWIARNQGLSWLYLNSNWGLYSNKKDLTDSGSCGRLILVKD